MTRRRACLACGGESIENILDLGLQNPVNNLSLSRENTRRIDLGLNACFTCGHGQLTTFVDPTLLFDNYLYASSTSCTLRNYESAFAWMIVNALPRPAEASILEIASNDGLLLEQFKMRNIRAVGIDPARTMAARANDRGLRTEVGFWPQHAHKFGGERFDLIIGQNVLAHTPNPKDFLASVHQHLEPDGLAMFQTSQADMVSNGEFDTVYHEHYSFFSERSAEALGKRAGFSQFAARYTAIHGTSALYLFADTTAAIERVVEAFDCAGRGWSEWRAKEDDPYRLRSDRSIDAWRAFGLKARQRMESVTTLASEAHKQGRRVIAVGAAAKSITFLRAANTEVDHLVDEAIDKIGLFVDGLDLHVESLSEFAYRNDDFFLITAWNFAEELATKLITLGVSQSGEACVYFPELWIGALGDVRP